MIDSWSKEQFLQVMSDVYKEIHGKDRGINYEEWSTEELKMEFLTLSQISIDNEMGKEM